MWNQRDDLQAPLDPWMQRSPEHRWAFIRKVYLIISLQLLAAIVTFVHPFATFFSTTPIGWAVYIVIFIAPFMVIRLIHIYQKKHPLNFVLLGIFILCFGLALGVVSALVGDGKIIIEAVLATAVVVISLTLLAARRGHRFTCYGPFWLSVFVIILMFTIFQIFFPMGKISEVMYSGLAVLLFSAYIIYYTLIEREFYDKYIWASVSLYLEVFKLFQRLLSCFRQR